MTAADPNPVGLDPAHILAICTRATGSDAGIQVTANCGRDPVEPLVQACGLDRSHCPWPGRLHRRPRQCRPSYSGPDRHRLERWPAGLTADRPAHGDASPGRQPAGDRDRRRPRFRRAAGRGGHVGGGRDVLDETRQKLRDWVDARAGICPPAPPAEFPPTPRSPGGSALRRSCEEVISDLIDRHVRVAEHAVDLFASLRHQMNGGRAERTAVRRAGIFFHLSSDSIAQDSTPLMNRPAPRARPSGAAASRRSRSGRPRRGMSGEFPAPPGAAGPPGTDPPAGTSRPGRTGLPRCPPGPPPLTHAPPRPPDLGGPMDLGSNHSDPFRDAIQDAVYRAVQVGSFAVTAVQVYAYHRRTQARITAEQDQRARRALNAQVRAERDADRTRWAPALDPVWLRHASLIETAQAWGAALPYADRNVPWHEPAAATAMTRCEERLRQPAPLRHGPLRPAAQRRPRPSRGDARSRTAVRPPSPGPGCVLRATTACWMPAPTPAS